MYLLIYFIKQLIQIFAKIFVYVLEFIHLYKFLIMVKPQGFVEDFSLGAAVHNSH